MSGKTRHPSVKQGSYFRVSQHEGLDTGNAHRFKPRRNTVKTAKK
jgi:hypothetical protein